MTVKTLRDQLLSNPAFVVNYIVENNPGAVEDRLRAMGFIISTPDDIFETLSELLRDGRLDDFREALTVPILTDGRDAAELAIVADISKANLHATDPESRFTGSAGKSLVPGPWNDGPMGAVSYADEGGGSASFWDTQAASGLIQGIFGLGAGVLTNFNLYKTPTTDAAPPPPKSTSSTTTIVIVLAVIILAAALFYLLKHK